MSIATQIEYRSFDSWSEVAKANLIYVGELIYSKETPDVIVFLGKNFKNRYCHNPDCDVIVNIDKTDYLYYKMSGSIEPIREAFKKSKLMHFSNEYVEKEFNKELNNNCVVRTYTENGKEYLRISFTGYNVA